MLQVRVNETGEVLDNVSSLQEGIAVIAQFIAEDEKNGCEYEKDYYEVYDTESGEQLYTK